MNTEKYFFKESTNLMLGYGICQILAWDCENFGFIKNDAPNISGLMNRLIPELSAYRDDLHERFLRHNKGDVALTAAIEQNIYQVYLTSFDLSDDSRFNIPFRINKQYQQDFVLIYEEKLQKYGLDFTNYVRTLLGEYALKPFYQRELFFYYRLIMKIKGAIKKEQILRWHKDAEVVEFIPTSIEVSPISHTNVITGFAQNEKTSVIVPVREADSIRITEAIGKMQDTDYPLISEKLKEYLQKEQEEMEANDSVRK